MPAAGPRLFGMIERGRMERDDPLRLMCVLAHPDDESMGTGGILAKYAAEGVETAVVCATRGERGWHGDPADDPGPTALGCQRERELREAARVLGVRRLDFLDYIDGDLDCVDPAEAVAKIVRALREVRPHVVVTFGPDGAYGHPDHIAISQFTTAAIVAAADCEYAPEAGPPHRVSKLYYFVVTETQQAAYLAEFGDIVMEFDGVARGSVVWPAWAVTTRIDCDSHWRTAWEAVACHKTQLPNLDEMRQWPEERHRRLWREQAYYRAFSLVNGGRTVEDDLFTGLR